MSVSFLQGLHGTVLQALTSIKSGGYSDTLLAPSSVAKADEIVAFPDPNLEAAVREAIEKPTGDIYQSDLEDLTTLRADFEDIDDLSGLGYCTSLTDLSLGYNNISDASPLSTLTGLSSLRLHKNQISDISSLSVSMVYD